MNKSWAGIGMSTLARQMAVVAVLVCIGLLGSAVPAQAHHWTSYGSSCLPPDPYDYGSCDADVSLDRIGTSHYAYARYAAWEDRIYVKNRTGGKVTWRLYIPGYSDPAGTVANGSCITWGGGTLHGCSRTTAGWNLPENVKSTLRVCVHTYHGAYCRSVWART